jgi:hypothetical protein
MDKLSEQLIISQKATSSIFRNLSEDELSVMAERVRAFTTDQITLFEQTLLGHCTNISARWGNAESLSAIDLDSLRFIVSVVPAIQPFMPNTTLPDYKQSELSGVKIMQAINMASGEYGLRKRTESFTVNQMVALALIRMFHKKARYTPEHMEWLGANSDLVLEHREMILERGSLEPEFIQALMSTHRSLAEGVL